MPAQDMEAFLTGQQDTTSCLPVGLTLDAAAAMFEPPAKRLRTGDGSLAGGSPVSWRALRGWTRHLPTVSSSHFAVVPLAVVPPCRQFGIFAFFLIWASLAVIVGLVIMKICLVESMSGSRSARCFQFSQR